MTEERRQSDKEFRKDLLEKLASQGDQYVELCQRVDHLETRLNVIEGDLKDNTFLAEKIAEDTSAIRSLQEDAAAAVRFFCRLAKWWRFLVRYVLLPIGGMIAMPYLIWYWLAHDYTFPIWVQRLFELWK